MKFGHPRSTFLLDVPKMSILCLFNENPMNSKQFWQAQNPPPLKQVFYACAPLKLKFKSKYEFPNLGRPITPPPFEKCPNLLVGEKKVLPNMSNYMGGHNRVTAESRQMHLTMCSTAIVDQLLFYRYTSFLLKNDLPPAPEVDNIIQ